jgi:hypothetical protein
MANGEPISQQPAPANQPKPSLLRQILGSALTGLAAGLATERPEESFAAGMAAIETARERERQRRIQEEGLAQQREQLELRRQEVTAQVEKLQAEKRLIDQNVALGNLQQIELQNRINDFEQKQRIEILKSITDLVEAFRGTGASLAAVLDNDPEKLNQFIKTLEAQGRDPTSAYIYIHNPVADKVLVFERSSDVLKEDIVIDTPVGKFTAPKGTPRDLVPALFNAFLNTRIKEEKQQQEERKSEQDKFNRLNALVTNLTNENRNILNVIARLTEELNLTVNPKRAQELREEIARLRGKLIENEKQLEAIRLEMSQRAGISIDQQTQTTATGIDVVSRVVKELKDLAPDKRDLALKQLVNQGILTQEQADEVAKRLGQGNRPSSGKPDANKLIERARRDVTAFPP